MFAEWHLGVGRDRDEECVDGLDPEQIVGLGGALQDLRPQPFQSGGCDRPLAGRTALGDPLNDKPVNGSGKAGDGGAARDAVVFEVRSVCVIHPEFRWATRGLL